MKRNGTDEKEINGTERETKRNGPFLSITMCDPFSIRSLPVFYNKTVRSVLFYYSSIILVFLGVPIILKIMMA